MKRWSFAAPWLLALALAAAPQLDYDPALTLPDGVQALAMEVCPVPRGFWEPLEAKGWKSACFLAHGDPFVLEKALALALGKAGYVRTARETQPLSGEDRFVLEQWRAEARELFVEYFLFPEKSAAVYLIAHPPH
ncbi:hypothetical protein [Oceanithermus desulfurans]